jgi:penicillin-binding protein 1A
MNKQKIKVIEKVVLVFILTASVLSGVVFGFITSEIKNFSGIENLKKFKPSIPTRLYDINGELIAELFQEKRNLVSFEDLPDNLINAFLAVEDKDFYEHFGINPIAIVRAMGKNIIASVKRGKITIVQGGSTITQQLAKRLFTSGERTVSRKVLEALLAFQIEKRFSKNEILEMYFNQIYLGHGCHGISTAGKFFFNKDVKHLGVAESSILAALPSKPSGYSPLKFPREAFLKNQDSLKRMMSEGFLKQTKADKILKEFWPKFLNSLKTEFPTKTAISKSEDKAPYFTDYIRQLLISRLGEDVIYNSGLSVYTTLNLKRQIIAQKSISDGTKKQNKVSELANAYYNKAVDRGLIGSYNTLRLIFSLPGIIVKNSIETKFKKHMVEQVIDSIDMLSLLTNGTNANKTISNFRTLITGISSSMKVEGALISIEPKTGYISALVGGSKFKVSNQYNRALQARRQPGSAFKPFVYGAGIESKRISTATVLPDAPILDINAQGDSWSPGNYGGEFTGMIPISKALPASVNIISIRVYDLLGPERVISYASKMLKVPESRFNPNPSLALGTTELTPFEMATAYSIYANRGRDVIPFALRYIVDRDGNEIVNVEEEVGKIIAIKEMNGSIQVISESVAWIMTNLMRKVISGGTAFRAIKQEAGFRKEAAGKTGTTSNWTDAWFCGFTADIATVVWMGYDRQFMSLGKHQSGATSAAPIWGKYMKEIYNGMDDPHFPTKPAGVYARGVCKYTGLLAGKNCKISGGYGLKGSGRARHVCDGKHYKMKTVIETYMEKEGMTGETD